MPDARAADGAGEPSVRHDGRIAQFRDGDKGFGARQDFRHAAAPGTLMAEHTTTDPCSIPPHNGV